MSRYFDHNATAPLSPTAREAWLRIQDEAWQNVSAPYRPAARARALLEDYRERLAALIGLSDARRLVFTSGATESTNAIIAHLNKCYNRGKSGSKAIFGALPGSHPSIAESIKHLWSGETKSLPIDSNGIVVIQGLHPVFKTTEAMAGGVLSIVAAHNETGAVQPLKEIGQWCREANIALHCDAAQWLGRLDPADLGEADWLTGSAHKSGGPKGIGFLVRAKDAQGLTSLWGGGQEGGHRAGTEDLANIAAMVEHLEFATRKLRETSSHLLAEGRDHFERILREALPGVRILADEATRLWNTSCIVLPRHDRIRWLAALEQCGILAAAGAACSSSANTPERTELLHAMGLRTGEPERVLRFSGGQGTTLEDWDAAAKAVLACLGKLDHRRNNESNVIAIPTEINTN